MDDNTGLGPRAVAHHPLPGAYTSWRGTRIGVERVELVRTNAPAQAPGMVAIAPEGLTVWAGDGSVRLVQIRHEDRVEPASALLDRGLIEGDLLT